MKYDEIDLRFVLRESFRMGYLMTAIEGGIILGYKLADKEEVPIGYIIDKLITENVINPTIWRKEMKEDIYYENIKL